MPDPYAPRFHVLKSNGLILFPAAGQWLAVTPSWHLLSFHKSPNAALQAYKHRSAFNLKCTPLERVEIGPHEIDLATAAHLYRAGKCSVLLLAVGDRYIHATDTGAIYGPFAYSHPLHSHKNIAAELARGHQLARPYASPLPPSTTHAAIRITFAADPPPTRYTIATLPGTFDTLDEMHTAARAAGMRRVSHQPVPAYTRPLAGGDDSTPGALRVTRHY